MAPGCYFPWGLWPWVHQSKRSKWRAGQAVFPNNRSVLYVFKRGVYEVPWGKLQRGMSAWKLRKPSNFNRTRTETSQKLFKKTVHYFRFIIVALNLRGRFSFTGTISPSLKIKNYLQHKLLENTESFIKKIWTHVRTPWTINIKYEFVDSPEERTDRWQE